MKCSRISARRLENAARGALAITVLFLGAARAEEVAAPGCEKPFVFDIAPANVIAVQYQSPEATEEASLFDEAYLDKLNTAAQHLAWYTKYNAWHQPAYGKLGAVAQIGGVINDCNADDMLNGLLGLNGVDRMLDGGRIVIIIEGRLFRNEDQILIQTTFRPFRVSGAPSAFAEKAGDLYTYEALTLDLPNIDEPMRAILPIASITFPPRIITTKELSQMEGFGGLTRQLYRSADYGAVKQQLSLRGDGGETTFIVEQTPEWVQVQDIRNGIESYVIRREDFSSWLHEEMPEFDFLNGLLGFLRYQQFRDGQGEALPEGAVGDIHRAFERYERRKKSQGDDHALALADIMRGVLAAQAVEPDWASSLYHFRSAVARDPYNGLYRNFVSLAEVRLCCTPGREKVFDGNPIHNMIDVLSLNPEDPAAIANLDVALQFLTAPENETLAPAGVSRDNLADSRNIIRKIREDIDNKNVETGKRISRVADKADVSSQSCTTDFFIDSFGYYTATTTFLNKKRISGGDYEVRMALQDRSGKVVGIVHQHGDINRIIPSIVRWDQRKTISHSGWLDPAVVNVAALSDDAKFYNCNAYEVSSGDSMLGVTTNPAEIEEALSRLEPPVE